MLSKPKQVSLLAGASIGIYFMYYIYSLIDTIVKGYPLLIIQVIFTMILGFMTIAFITDQPIKIKSISVATMAFYAIYRFIQITFFSSASMSLSLTFFLDIASITSWVLMLVLLAVGLFVLMNNKRTGVYFHIGAAFVSLIYFVLEAFRTINLLTLGGLPFSIYLNRFVSNVSLTAFVCFTCLWAISISKEHQNNQVSSKEHSLM